ncbi:MAG TPA: hypothetical protein VEW26_05745 [Allosphingosinicella sp.]|nr:hypothetical protein [Allosphingosinicella sp.]
MVKRIKLLGSIAIAAILLSAAPASAQGGAAYHTVFYSDSSHTTQVGYLIWTGCNGDSPTYRLVGTYTIYSVDEEYIGYCYEGEMYPA